MHACMAMSRLQTLQKDDIHSKSSLHGHAGVYFNIKGWSPKLDTHIFEELEKQKVLADDEVRKKIIFSQSCLLVAIQGCILMLMVGA